jgi:sugar phosphate isomerase/epimerase
LTEKLSGIGFDGIECTPLKFATGTWPADPKQKELGRWMQLISKTGFEAYGLALMSRELGMKTSEINDLVDATKKDISNKKIHAYFIAQVIFPFIRIKKKNFVFANKS